VQTFTFHLNAEINPSAPLQNKPASAPPQAAPPAKKS
jgi:hypothetical protein